MYIILSRCVGDTLTLSEVRLFLNIKYGTFGNIDLSYLYVTISNASSALLNITEGSERLRFNLINHNVA